MSIAYRIGRAAGRHPVVALTVAVVLVAACVAMNRTSTPPAAPVQQAAQWQAPVDPADTPARRERHRKAREAEAVEGALRRMR